MANGWVRNAVTRVYSVIKTNKDEITVVGSFTATVFVAGLGVMGVKNHYDLKHAEQQRQIDLAQAEQKHIHAERQRKIDLAQAEQQRQIDLAQAEQRRKTDLAHAHQRREQELQQERVRVQLAEERARTEQRLFDAAFHADYVDWRRAMTILRPKESKD